MNQRDRSEKNEFSLISPIINQKVGAKVSVYIEETDELPSTEETNRMILFRLNTKWTKRAVQ